MGRKTYEQMKNLIKDNIPLVITSQNINNINTVNNLDDIDSCVNKIIDMNNIYKVFVLGGQNIYDYFLLSKKFNIIVYCEIYI